MLRNLEASEWYFDMDGEVVHFFKEVEALAAFNIPLKYTPLKFNVYQEET